jgi:hypothetical protein
MRTGAETRGDSPLVPSPVSSVVTIVLFRQIWRIQLILRTNAEQVGFATK